ncbi:MAG: hypothetical protein UH850_10510 [Paludibacteraceae bacterium]|nr:hypothetical protein [Paludibacteraceae bacterium]
MDAMFEFLFWLAVAFMVRQAVLASERDEKKDGEEKTSSFKKTVK